MWKLQKWDPNISGCCGNPSMACVPLCNSDQEGVIMDVGVFDTTQQRETAGSQNLSAAVVVTSSLIAWRLKRTRGDCGICHAKA